MISLCKWISWFVAVLYISVECMGFDGSCCQQGCINTVAGIRCVCRRGFRLVNRCQCRGKLWWLQNFKRVSRCFWVNIHRGLRYCVENLHRDHKLLWLMKDRFKNPFQRDIFFLSKIFLWTVNEFVNTCPAVLHRKTLFFLVDEKYFGGYFFGFIIRSTVNHRGDEFMNMFLRSLL